MKHIPFHFLWLFNLLLFLCFFLVCQGSAWSETITIEPVAIGTAKNLKDDGVLILPPLRKVNQLSRASEIVDLSSVRFHVSPSDSPTTMKVNFDLGNGYFLVAHNGGGGLVHVNKKTNSWADFILIDMNGGKLLSQDCIQIKSSDGRYCLSVQDRGTAINMKSEQAGQNEIFTILSTTGKKEIKFGDSVAFRTHYGLFISAGNKSLNTVIKGDKLKVQAGETFKLVASLSTLIHRPIMMHTPHVATPIDIIAPLPSTRTRAPSAPSGTTIPETLKTVNFNADVIPIKASEKREEVRKKNMQLLSTKMNLASVKPNSIYYISPASEIEKVTYGINDSIKEENGLGPSNNPIMLIENIRSDVENIDYPISMLIYSDQNPHSGLYYFLPGEYNLVWEAGSYQLTIDYFAATEEDQPGDIMVMAYLHSGLRNSDLQLAKELLDNYSKKRGIAFKDLLPVPLMEKPKVTFNFESLYNIPEDKISVQQTSNMLERISISWISNRISKENMQLVLFDLGLQGIVTFHPAGDYLPRQDIGATIHPADSQTFGEIPWKRGKSICNETPYTLQYKYLHMLIKEKDTDVPIFYTWDLKNTKIPPQSSANIKSTTIPFSIAQKAMRTWIEYDITDRTDEQNKTVLEMISKGVYSLAVEDIIIHPTNAFSGTDAYRIIFKVRSKYFKPKATEMIIKQMILEKDGVDIVIPAIYKANWDHQSSGTEPLFEYQLEIILPNGQNCTCEKWIPCKELHCYFGTSQIKELFGSLPSADESS